MLNINKLENNGYYYPGMAKEVAFLVGCRLRNTALVKGDEPIKINDDVYKQWAIWAEDGDVIKIQSMPRGEVSRIPRSVFEKYFQPFDPEKEP